MHVYVRLVVQDRRNVAEMSAAIVYIAGEDLLDAA
jgi:hypothetical protein